MIHVFTPKMISPDCIPLVMHTRGIHLVVECTPWRQSLRCDAHQGDTLSGGMHTMEPSTLQWDEHGVNLPNVMHIAQSPRCATYRGVKGSKF